MAKMPTDAELRIIAHNTMVNEEMQSVIAVLGTGEFVVYGLAICLSIPNKDEKGISVRARLSRHTSHDMTGTHIKTIITALNREIGHLKEALTS